MGLGYSLVHKPTPTMLADRLEDALIAIAEVRDSTNVSHVAQRLSDLHDELAGVRDLQRHSAAATATSTRSTR